LIHNLKIGKEIEERFDKLVIMTSIHAL